MHDLERRSPRRITILISALLAIALAMPTLASAAASYSIAITKVADGFSSPTQVTNAGDGTRRLFVVEQRGTVRVVQGSTVLPGYFLDIRSKVSSGGERGLLGLAFHPDFKKNRTLFVYYTRSGGDIVVAKFRTNSARTNVSERTYAPIMLIEHSRYANHNGGAMAFSPGGLLYLGIGDGGGSGDPSGNGQKKTTLLGKILRINVDGTGDGAFNRYDIPSSNPYAGPTAGRGEIWSRGVRNPWRISFDRATGDLFIADVGQGKREEVNRQTAGKGRGRNYGWNIMEGTSCNRPSRCPLAGDTLPVAQYSHSGGNCSITGGYVYRGSAYPAMAGQYIFADYCSGRIWSMPARGSRITQRANTDENPTSFGESEGGELYMVASSGVLYRVRSQ